MAELTGEYLADRMSSRQLLALLFVCECLRKKTLGQLWLSGREKLPGWREFAERFAARIVNLPESERVYLIGSHLQSSEELDIYSNEIMEGLLEQHDELLNLLVRELESDPRFARK